MATITDKQMQARPAAGDKWLTHSFKRGSGALVGRITPAGERLFYFRHTDSTGARRLYPIGPYHPKGADGLTLAQAFDRASGLSELYRSGVTDLREHFERQRQAEAEAQHQADVERRRIADEAEQALQAAQRRATVRTLFEQWQRAELVPQSNADGTRIGRKDGGEWVRQAFERRVFPKIGDVPAESVTRADLLAIIDDCKAGGTLRTAQVLFTDLRQMFRFAAEREIVAFNPLDGLRRAKIGGKSTERQRVLSDDELEALRLAIPGARMNPRSAIAVWLILGTAARIGEAMTARWEHVDTERRTWYLPDTKNQRDHTIHLSDFALSQMTALQELRELDKNGKPTPWLFPNTAGDGPVCIKSFGKQLADRQRQPEKRMSGRSKRTGSLALPGGKWTAHDLRRTAATMMARLGVSTDVIDECLNHKLQSKVAKVYVRDRREAEQAGAFKALGRKLQALAEGHHGAQVIELQSKRA